MCVFPVFARGRQYYLKMPDLILFMMKRQLFCGVSANLPLLLWLMNLHFGCKIVWNYAILHRCGRCFSLLCQLFPTNCTGFGTKCLHMWVALGLTK